MTNSEGTPEAKFRFLADEALQSDFKLVSEWSGREISIAPGQWVDVECINADGTPVEIEARADGSIAVYAKYVSITGEDGAERLS